MNVQTLQETTRTLARVVKLASYATGENLRRRCCLRAVEILDELVALDPDPLMQRAYRTEQTTLRAVPSAAKLEELAVDYAGLAGSDPRDDLASDVFAHALCWADVCLACGADKVSTHCVICGTDHTIHA